MMKTNFDFVSAILDAMSEVGNDVVTKQLTKETISRGSI